MLRLGVRAGRILGGPPATRRLVRRVSAAALERLAAMRVRYDELCEEATVSVLAPSGARELSELGDVLACLEAWEAARAELRSLEDLEEELEGGTDEGDAELLDEARSERAALLPRVEELGGELRARLLPRDETDDAPACIVEVKAAAGGDEATLFAGDLLHMYEKFAGRRRCRWEVMSLTKSDCGGVSHAYAEVCGRGAYASLKFESGVHRVQRVPKNDVRIHTSTASVVVFPSAADDDTDESMDFDASDLRIDTFRASGAGGQHVNTTNSAVRITHLPTNTVVSIQDERSQHRNKAKALKVLASRVHGAKRAADAAQRSESRARLAGSGDRAERIRTYNAPHDRVVDHRSNHTANSMDRVLKGDLLDDILGSLEDLDKEHRIAEFERASS